MRCESDAIYYLSMDLSVQSFSAQSLLQSIDTCDLSFIPTAPLSIISSKKYPGVEPGPV